MRKLLLAAFLPLLAACNQGTVCPAGFGYEQGLIHIDSAALGNTALTSVNITNVTIGGQAQTATRLVALQSGVSGALNGAGNAYGLRAEGDALVCGVACAFGRTGHVTFDVGTAGGVTQHDDLTIAATGVYSGSCLSYFTGTPVHLNLKFEPTPRTQPLSRGGRVVN